MTKDYSIVGIFEKRNYPLTINIDGYGEVEDLNILKTVHSTQITVHRSQYTDHSSQYTGHRAQYTKKSAQSAKRSEGAVLYGRQLMSDEG